jgi:hypothetical protein
MECLTKPKEMGRTGTPTGPYDSGKIAQIRDKIAIVFGSPSSWDDMTISRKYNITGDGDLIMIIR